MFWRWLDFAFNTRTRRVYSQLELGIFPPEGTTYRSYSVGFSKVNGHRILLLSYYKPIVELKLNTELVYFLLLLHSNEKRMKIGLWSCWKTEKVNVLRRLTRLE